MNLQEQSNFIRETYKQLNLDNLNLIDQLYSEDIRFEDPLTKIKGRQDLKTYLNKFYENVKDVHFEFTDETAHSNTHMISWILTFKTNFIPTHLPRIPFLPQISKIPMLSTLPQLAKFPKLLNPTKVSSLFTSEIKIEGISRIRFDNHIKKIIYQRDYFDLGESIYEHIPIFKYFILLIKNYAR